MPNKIRLSRSDISFREYFSVFSCMREGMLGMGKFVKKFEILLSDYLKSNVVCVSSGTSALHIALESLNLEQGSEVLVPSLTYVATYQAIKAAGLTPKSVDIDINTCNINRKLLEDAFSPKSKVIVPVLYAGNTSGYREILKWAKEKSLRVIVDAAHAFGSKDQDQLVGSFGDITCFSFDGIKNITSGEGGCIVSKDMNLINLSKDKRLLSVQKDTEMRYSNRRSWDFEVINQGWRYHMSNVHASIGIAQFKRKKYFFEKRRINAKYYDKLLANSAIIRSFSRNYDEIVPHIYPVLLNANVERDSLIKYLKEYGIESGIHYKPNHKLAFFRNNYSLPNTEDIFPRLISLPLHTYLSKKQIRYIVSIINKFESCK